MLSNPSPLQQRVHVLQAVMPGFSLRYLGDQAGYAQSTVRNWMCGLKGDTPEFTTAIEQAVTRLEAQAGTATLPPGALSLDDIDDGGGGSKRPRKRGEHYDLRITRRVGTVLDYCLENASLGLVVAGFGAGKSYAIREWRRKNPKADFVGLEFNEFLVGNKCAFIARLALALGLQVAGGGTVASERVFGAVIAHLRENPTLLVFDQCEALRVSVAQVIRQLWDYVHDDGSGIVLLGAPGLYDKLRNSRSQDLGALTSRIRPWAILSGVERGEMEAVLRTEGIEIDDAGVDLLWRVVNGSMRSLCHAVEMIRAKHRGAKLGRKGVAQVCEFLHGLRLEVE